MTKERDDSGMEENKEELQEDTAVKTPSQPETEASGNPREASPESGEPDGGEEAAQAEGAQEEDSEETGTEEALGESESKAERKALKKKQKADKKQDALKEKIEELEDRVKRQMAEFENFRKRTDREKAAMFETGAKSVIEKILPVVDNFERGLASIPEEEKGSPFAEGMEMIYKQLLTELDKMEVKVIPTVGEEFNPEFHNAVMQVESEEFESGIIAQELQKGYTYRDSVVRHSMVAVVS